MAMSHDAMIAVIKAHKAGKNLECRSVRYYAFPADDPRRRWQLLEDDPSWNFANNLYRVARDHSVLVVSPPED